MSVVRSSPGPTPSSAGPGPLLTTSELRVLVARAEGQTNAAIAREAGWHEASVEMMASHVTRKLGARNMPHAVLLACRAGILDGRPRRHGDHAGFAAHVARGEEPCDACWEGEREYRRDRRRARKEAKTRAA